MTAAISSVRLDNITKVFGGVRALTSVNLAIEAGDVVAIMGPNGAGKSTLLSIVSSLMRPTRGQVIYRGDEDRTFSDAPLDRIGVLSHQPLIYPDLSAEDNLIFFARLYGVSNPVQKVRGLIEELSISDFRKDRPTRVLSRGQLQRVALARALVADPDFLLLDEPAAGLDSKAITRIQTALETLTQRGGLGMIVTHDPGVAFRTANRAVMLRKGQIVSDRPAPDSAEEWRELYFATVEGEKR